MENASLLIGIVLLIAIALCVIAAVVIVRKRRKKKRAQKAAQELAQKKAAEPDLTSHTVSAGAPDAPNDAIKAVPSKVSRKLSTQSVKKSESLAKTGSLAKTESLAKSASKTQHSEVETDAIPQHTERSSTVEVDSADQNADNISQHSRTSRKSAAK